jgi:hypothetical protein
MFYNNHYGKLLKNVTKNIEIDFTVLSHELENMELDSDEPDHGNEFKVKLKPGEEAFVMLRPIRRYGPVSML